MRKRMQELYRCCKERKIGHDAAFFAATGNSGLLRTVSRAVGNTVLPLYHLTAASERLQAIREARRVLRPGGVLMAVAISRFASALDGIARGFIRDPEFVRMVRQDLDTGQHRNQTGNANYFTTAFFHHPDELRAELIEAGFADPKLCAIEGPLWSVTESVAEEQQQELMATMRVLESEPSLIGASAHIMCIAIGDK